MNLNKIRKQMNEAWDVMIKDPSPENVERFEMIEDEFKVLSSLKKKSVYRDKNEELLYG